MVAATDTPVLNAQVADAARARRIFVNAVDDAGHCSFHVPAIVRRGPLQVAVSSAGLAPLLAGRVRERLEQILDDSLGAMIALVGEFRTAIRRHYRDLDSRRRFYARLWEGPVLSVLRRRRRGEAMRWIATALERGNDCSPFRGCIVLVGAEPSDPGLLTLHGLRHLQAADVILYDRLVGDGVLALARRDAERINVANRAGGGQTRQAHIHALMQHHAQAGRRVVRFKGGDPLVFGRGGEELEFLRSRGIDYEVVPGVTAALACAAYAGIPLTHRDRAHSVTLASGHMRDSGAASALPLTIPKNQTLVVYMAIRRLTHVQARLLAGGSDPATPFALIENATLANQRVVSGRLDRLATPADSCRVQPPALLVVGAVAALAGQLNWNEDRMCMSVPPSGRPAARGRSLGPGRADCSRNS